METPEDFEPTEPASASDDPERPVEDILESAEEAVEEDDVIEDAREANAGEIDTEEPSAGEAVHAEAAYSEEEPVAESDETEDTSGDEVTVEPELEAAVEEAFEGVDTEAVATESSDAVATEGVEGEGDEEVLDEWLPGDWFVVHTYAGYENKVKADLETRVASMNMEDKIYEVVIPMEDVVEIKGGKKQTVQRKVFPGYLLVRMDMDDDSWYVVRNTPGVTGFVGSGTKPIPLSEREVDKILGRKGEAEKPKPRAEWAANDPVRVTTGPFANFQGVISEVDGERQKVKVLVNIFGRETPVELSFDQISKV
jgi:transcriptional antiterminator NusG